MRLSQRFARRAKAIRKISSAAISSARVNSSSKHSRAVAHPLAMIDALECRRLLTMDPTTTGSETVTSSIPPVLASLSNPATNSVTLDNYFFDATLPGTLVTFTTSEGTIQVGLTDAATPVTVSNFLSYVNGASGDNYDDTIFHRSVNLTTNQGGSPTAPATIIQGGGYILSGSQITHIATSSPIPDEYTTELYGDVTGTLAMAKTSYANSATSEWYFNVSDNTELDTPTTDPNGVTTSYTVFGKVLSGMDVIDTIAALPTYALNSDLTDVPVTGLTEAQAQAGASISADNLVFTESVTAEPGTSYVVTSDDKALVDPTVTNGVLSFTYGSGLSGTAAITVTAKNLDGTSASTTFTVTVPNSATPTAGPVAADVTAPTVVTGTSQSFSVLDSASDSLAPIALADTTITFGPLHGIASVNSTNGAITYTPTAGYVGTDTLSFTVTDTEGNTSLPATVTLTAVPVAVSVVIGGAGNPAALTFTQPDGVTGHVTYSGPSNDSLTITFANYQVTTEKAGGAIIATGAGATIASIAETQPDRPVHEVVVKSNGPVTIGGLDFGTLGNLYEFYGPEVTLTGTSSFGGLALIDAAAIDDASLTMGAGYPTSFLVNTVTNSNIQALYVSYIKSNNWLNTDGGSYNLSAQSIDYLDVPTTFAENLDLQGKNYDLILGKLGQVSGTWDLSGSMYKTTLSTSPTTGWSLSAQGVIASLGIKGNLENTIVAAAIDKFSVSGTTTDSTIETDATFGAKYKLIGSLSFKGAVSNTVVFSTGNVGTITAPSFTNSRVYAGVEVSVAQNGALAASASDLSANASIGSITLGAFSDGLISTDIIGSLKLGKIDTSNNGTPEGVSAHKISSVSGILTPGGTLRAGAAQLKSAAALAAYEKAEKLTLGDFEINLF